MAIDMNQARKGKLTANAHHGVASATIAAFELFDGMAETASVVEAWTPDDEEAELKRLQ